MSQINEVYPNIENPEGLNAPDIVSEKTSYIFPVSGPEPQQPDHYVTKKYYEENIPVLSIPTQMPIRGIIMWSGSITEIPENWALCDGSIVNEIQTPDLRGRFLVGAGSDAGEGEIFDVVTGAVSGQYAPGDTGGETAHQLTEAELASHNHSYQAPVAGTVTTGSNVDIRSQTASTTGTAGSDHYHENRPPYYALAFIIKVA